ARPCRPAVQTFPSSDRARAAATCASPGQSDAVPVQYSVTSHSPAAVRQTVVAGRNPSGGHELLRPSHVSAISQGPVAERQTSPACPAGWIQAGAPIVPLQMSVVQTLPSSVHVVPAAITTSGGQLVLVPLHVSATSPPFEAARP